MKISNSTITPGFWQHWIDVNHDHAITHQWEQLDASGCIDNFRILAGEVESFRQGWFFADSDAYKWLDAASRISASHPSGSLTQTMDTFIDLLAKSQAEDGYLFTYNQIHFPGTRWVNLQIEHELYCHGHLIEAGVSHFIATGTTKLLAVAQKAADRIVADFLGKDAAFTPGHEEIEIAFLRLYEVTHHPPYLELAQQFLTQRGTIKPFAPQILRQFLNVGKRANTVLDQQHLYEKQHQTTINNRVPPGNTAKKPPFIKLRWYLNAVSGKYFQQHRPLLLQDKPTGHSVRYTYLTTAAAMFDRIKHTRAYLPVLETAWKRMVQRRMYVTGGIGSLPELEGFGRDYELDPEIAYAETCAALGSIFWNWAMAQTTNKSCYSDLLEWQLYNAALVGMGQNGVCYLYNNPLASHGGIKRRSWYAVPCCPSNISRFLADLQHYIATVNSNIVYLHQYISSQVDILNEEKGLSVRIHMESGLPWQDTVTIRISCPTDTRFHLNLRNPSWSATTSIQLNGWLEREVKRSVPDMLDPLYSEWISLDRTWQDGDEIILSLDLSARLLHAHPRVKGHHGKATVARGPLVYCLESCDQPDIDLFNAVLDKSSITPIFDQDLLEGIWTLEATTTDGQPLTFIPYHLWANRGETQMTVWVYEQEKE